jgi:hypothetical protein
MKNDEMKTDDIKTGARKRRLPLPRAFLLAAAVSLALGAVFLAAASSAGSGLYDQRAAERWSRPAGKPEETPAPTDAAPVPTPAGADGTLKNSEMGYSQVSAFFARNSGLGYVDMMRLRQGLADKYTADGITPPEEDARLWIDAASGAGTATVTGGKSGTASVSVTGILGDFFFFHPAKLLSGQYINTNEASKDYVMLDWNTAWRVFGGYDAAGMRVEVGGIPCVVAGVFEKDEGDEAENRIYASFELLEKLSPGAELTALDFVLSAPITGYGTQAIEGLVASVPSAERVIVENSARFTRGNLLGTLGDPGAITAKTNAVALPYWENAARAAALRGAVFLLLAMIFAALPLITAVILLAKLYMRRGRFLPWAARTFKAARARAGGTAPPAL